MTNKTVEGVGMQARNSKAAIGLCVLGAVSVIGVVATARDEQVNVAQVNQAFSLAHSRVIELALPADADQPMLVDIVIDDVPVTLRLRPHSLRSEDYKLYEALPDGSFRVVDPGPVRTMRGTVGGEPGAVVAASLADDGLTAMIRHADGTRTWIEPIGAKVPGASPEAHVVYKSQDVIKMPGQCGMPDVGPNFAVDVAGEAAVAGAADCITQLGIEADYPYFVTYGTIQLVNIRMESVINTVNTQYEAEVDITHVIAGGIVRTSPGSDPYDTTVPVDLVCQFSNEWNAFAFVPADVAHLFTGRDLDGTTIGRAAAIGSICETGLACGTFPCTCTPDPQFTDGSYCVNQSDWSANFACVTDLSAHELGHLWGAVHCACPTNTMNPNINCVNTFSAASIGLITTYRNTRVCLDCTGDASFCGDGNAGSCYQANASPYCDDTDCCDLVCAADPFCCNTRWDNLCANAALVDCGNCGGPGAGDCFASNGSPGCEDADCCAIVCNQDDFCCDNSWDGLCAGHAAVLCGAPLPPSSGVLYFSRDGFSELYELNMVTGAATLIGVTGVESFTVGLCPSANRQVLYGSKPFGVMHISSDGAGFAQFGTQGSEGMAYDPATDTLYSAINAVFQTLNPLDGSVVAMLASPGVDVEGLAFANGGVYAIGGDANLRFYTPGSNSWSIIGSTGITWDMAGLAYSAAEDALYGLGDQDANLYRIDTTTAATRLVGSTGIAEGGGLAWLGPLPTPASNGTLYFSEDSNANGLYEVSMIDGSVTNIGLTTVSQGNTGLAPSDQTMKLYGSERFGFTHIDAEGAGVSQLSGVVIEGLAYDPGSGRVYGAINGAFFLVDPDTGANIGALAAPGVDIEGIAFGGGLVYGLPGSLATTLHAYDPGTDTWSVIGDTGISWDQSALAYNGNEHRLYAKGNQSADLHRIHPFTAATEIVGTTGVVNGGGMAWVPPLTVSGELYYSRDGISNGLFTLNMNDGGPVHVGTTNVSGGTVGLTPSGNPDLLFGSKPFGLLHIDADGSGSTQFDVTGIEGLAYDPAAGSLYAGINGAFFRVDASTGANIGGLAAPGIDAEGLAFGNGGVYALPGSAVSTLHFYDPTSNSWSIIGDTGVAWDQAGLAYHARENRLYGVGDQDGNLYRINPINAATTVVGDTGISNGGGLGWVGPRSGCPWDLDGDANVGIVDFLGVLAAWGSNPGNPADFDGDGVVGISDFLDLLAHWGPCPTAAAACGGAVICGEPYLSCGGDCFCFQLDYVSGVCTANFFCADVSTCPPQGCPLGFGCVTNSCCGVAVCVPLTPCNASQAAGPLVGHTAIGYIAGEN